jgi:hypothetical protein
LVVSSFLAPTSGGYGPAAVAFKALIHKMFMPLGTPDHGTGNRTFAGNTIPACRSRVLEARLRRKQRIQQPGHSISCSDQSQPQWAQTA